jgi:alpha-L-rhamnosidase
MSVPQVTSVRAELRTDSTDVGVAKPRLSWKTTVESPGWLQASAEIQLDDAATATVTGRDSVLVDWPFEAISPRSIHSVRVRVTGEDGVASDWSEPQQIRAAFLADGDWTAPMIGLANPERAQQPLLLRKSFEVTGPVAKATLYATAQGAYQAEINGTEVDDQILKPGWTSYQWHLIHETTDVTSLLHEGANAIGISLAGGWFTEKFGFRQSAALFYGANPAAAAQLVIDYADGSTETILTDGSWKATAEGPITASGIYLGESYDATREIDGWSHPEFDDGGWSAARVDTADYPTPQPRNAPAVRAIQEVSVVDVITTPAGATVLDFGQNLVGHLRIEVSGERGHTVTLRHAEVLEHGELGVRPLRNALSVDTYTLAGSGVETWEPAFTFHGFRYAQIDNWPGELDPTAITAVVVHSDMERTGWFDSSHELVNRLHENVVWGMKGNFLYVPTDCPQRDERLGWTGDIQVFSPTASFLFEVDSFLTSWLVDLEFEQKNANGVVPIVIPAVLPGEARNSAAWGDAAAIVPIVLHERFGNLKVVEDQFESMKSWCDSVMGYAGDRYLWEDHFQFGDWLDPDAPPEFPGDAKTDNDIVASAYLYRSVDFTVRAAELLGRSEDAAKYGSLREKIHAAFLSEYVTSSGRMMSDAQTAYATAIQFGLYRDEAQRQAMGDRLAELTRSSGYRIGTGFVGTPLICDALTDTGHLDIATRLLTQTESPSWLYSVTMGATTVWERWDSMLEDGTINPGEMTSFNHYALGAVADWLHREVAGLAPATPGYRSLHIAPHVLDGFDHATATHETPYGLASSGWVRTRGASGDEHVTVSITVPANTTASVILPGSSETIEVGSGSHEWTVARVVETRTPEPLTRHTPLAAIIDDPLAYETVWKLIEGFDDHASKMFRRHTKWTNGSPLIESLFRLPPRLQDEIDAALDDINAKRSLDA